MQYVVGSLVALATLGLAVGAISGSVRARSCCAPDDPSRDRRMQAERDTSRHAQRQRSGRMRESHRPRAIGDHLVPTATHLASGARASNSQVRPSPWGSTVQGGQLEGGG